MSVQVRFTMRVVSVVLDALRTQTIENPDSTLADYLDVAIDRLKAEREVIK